MRKFNGKKNNNIHNKIELLNLKIIKIIKIIHKNHQHIKKRKYESTKTRT